MATPFRLKRSAISGKRPEIGDLQLGELALNFYDGYLFARRDTGGVGIADTVSLLNPWTENFGAGSIFYEQSVGIGTTSPTEKLTVFGSAYVSENFNTKTLFSSTITSNNGIFTSFSVSGLSTFSDNVDINAAIDVDGHTELDELNVAGVSTFASDLDINAAIDVDGHTELDELQVTGVSTFNAEVKISGSNVLSFNNSSLNISHTGTNANIFNGSGDLIFGADGNRSIKLERVGVATLALFKHGGQVELYYNGSKKLETTNEGILVSGLTTTGTLSVTGVSTFSGDLDINAAIDVDGHTELDELNVAGVSTFASDLDINAAIDVDGHTELDELNVAGVSTFASDLDINAAIDVDGHTELDELRVTGVSTFTADLDINAAIDVDGHTELDELNVSGVSTFAGLADFNGGVDISGHVEIDNISISGVTTFTDTTNNTLGDADTGAVQIDGGVGINKNATIGGSLDIGQDLNVTGVSTFSSDLDINAAIDVDGHTELDELNVAGVATFVSAIDANGGLDVFGQTELDNLNVSGIATIASLDVQTNFDVYDSTATFHNNVYITGNLSIGGTTTVLNAQDLQIFDKDIILGVTTDSNGNDISTDITANHAGVAVASTEGYPLVELYLEGLEELPTTYKKIMWFKEGSFSGLGTDAWLFNYAVGIGSTQFPTGTRFAVGEIQFTDDTIDTPQLFSGISTFTGTTEVRNSSFKVTNTSASGQYLEIIQNVDSSLNLNKVGTGAFFIKGNNIYLGDDDSAETYAGFEKDGKVFLKFDNSTKLETTGYGVTITGGVYVSGISTFASDLDINAAIDVDGHTELDELQVTGVSTFTADIDINAAIDVDGHTELDELNVAGVSTFASDLDINAAIDVDGHTELDELNVSGISTFGNDVEFVGPTAGITSAYWDSSANTLKFLDDVKATFGDGEDLKIYHDSATNISYINESGSGRLEIRGSDLYLADEDGTTMLYAANNAGVSLYYGGGKTFETTGFGVTVYNTLQVPQLNITGLSTFTDTTDNTLGDADTGAVQIDGGLGVNKNVTVGGNLNVQGYSELVGVVTFRGGTINIGDADTDDVNVGGEFISSLIPNDDATYTLGSSSKRWRDGIFSGIVTTNNLYASGITTTVLFNVGVGGTVITTTETGLVGINSTAPTVTLDVGGTINSNTDVTINGTSILTTAENDAVALAIALG